MTKKIKQFRNEIRALSNKNEIVFLIGNGINRYNGTQSNSWENLLKKIYNNVSPSKITTIPGGLHLTEFFEILDLMKSTPHNYLVIQKEFLTHLHWPPGEHHKKIIDICIKYNIPVMTTNFDFTLETACNAKKFFTVPSLEKGFSSYYPWESYFSTEKQKDHLNSFSIWHLQGQMDYPSSIKLGTRHYFKMINRALECIPVGNKKTKDRYENTWLKFFFTKALFIFGLGLDEQELFIRWILLERARWFKRKSKEETRPTWFLFIEEFDGIKNNGQKKKFISGKDFYFKHLGIEYIKFQTCSEFYEEFWEGFQGK